MNTSLDYNHWDTWILNFIDWQWIMYVMQNTYLGHNPDYIPLHQRQKMISSSVKINCQMRRLIDCVLYCTIRSKMKNYENVPFKFLHNQ